MIAVIQRVSEASVTIDSEIYSNIVSGMVVLLGIENEDDQTDIDWLTKKIVNLRIFDDGDGVMNNSLLDTKGEILLISQFTLHASTKKGNRPSYIKAAKPDIAIPLYESVIDQINRQVNIPIKTGVFGADMKVSLTNDGPVTIIIDTKNKI